MGSAHDRARPVQRPPPITTTTTATTITTLCRPTNLITAPMLPPRPPDRVGRPTCRGGSLPPNRTQLRSRHEAEAVGPDHLSADVGRGGLLVDPSVTPAPGAAAGATTTVPSAGATTAAAV